MACFHPLPAFKTRNGNVVLWKEQSDSLPLRLPCGGCLGCRKASARSWALRCSLELQLHPRAAFSTLTYSDSNLPATLSKRHLQLFLKRARKSLARSKRSVRFFACGEYGEQTQRPHYHAILYGVDANDRSLIDEAWGLGRTQTVHVTPAAISYVAGYTSKKIGFKMENQDVIDFETGELLYEYVAPFTVMSRRPGIGGHARQWPASWRSFAVSEGRPQPVPRFLHKSWKDQATPEEIEALEFEKSQLAQHKDYSPRALAAKEAIMRAKQALDGAKRRL